MALSKLITLIPAGLAVWKIYQQKDDIQQQLDKLKDETNANLIAVRDEVDKVNNRTQSIVDDLTIEPVGYFHSIVNMYWDTAFFVTIKNNSKYTCYIRGIRMSYSIGGNIADFYPYVVGKFTIQPNGSIRIRLGGTNNICVFLQKAIREEVRQQLKSAGTGNYTKMFCNVEVVTGSEGFNDTQKFVRKNVEGKAYYENSDWVGSYSNQGNRGMDVELFDGSK